jgi:uncharacterized cupredoxin-like copper-binding protein
MATPRPMQRFFSAPMSWCSAAGMVKLSRITRTSLTLFAAFLLLFKDAPGFRSADLAGAPPIRSAPNLEGLWAIGRVSKEGAVNQGCDNILYIQFTQTRLIARRKEALMSIDAFHERARMLFAIALALAASNAGANGDEYRDPAYGKAGDPAKVSRTVAIDMSDSMRFTPAVITARKGETIRFALSNSGKVRHEMVLGSSTELKEHAALMRKFPEMQHSDPNRLTVDPGKTGALVWQFTRAGTFDFACLQPGHFEAGMRGKITVR